MIQLHIIKDMQVSRNLMFKYILNAYKETQVLLISNFN